VTTANECFILLSVSSIKTYTTTELKAVPVPVSSEEEMEQRGRREEESRAIKYQTPEGTIEIPTERLEEEVIEMPGGEVNFIQIRRAESEEEE